MSRDRPVEQPPAELLAERLSHVLEPIYRHLDELAAMVEASHPPARSWTERHLVAVIDRIIALLAEDPITVGLGFVAAPGEVDGLERYMAWWQRSNGRISRLRLNFDPTSIDVYDYLQMEWFQLAQQEGGRIAYGPYVDYSGAELYIVTVTVPVHFGGRFVGVMGADLVVSELERRLVAVLREAPMDAVVVSGERRVIAANTPRWVVGGRLPELPTADDGEYAAVAALPVGIGWVVALAPPG